MTMGYQKETTGRGTMVLYAQVSAMTTTVRLELKTFLVHVIFAMALEHNRIVASRAYCPEAFFLNALCRITARRLSVPRTTAPRAQIVDAWYLI